MDVGTLHARSVEAWLEKVRLVTGGRWAAPTPCVGWDVLAVANHVVGEDRWTAPLVEGLTIEQVGSRLDGDLLGRDPAKSAEDAAKEAVHAFAAPGALQRQVHLSFGVTPAEVYAWQLTADHLIHAWDLAAGAGVDRALDDDLVQSVADWFAAEESGYRGGGVIGARPDVVAETAQERLLVAFGRDPSWGST